MRISIFLALCLLTFGFSCSSQEVKNRASLQKAVEEKHDTIMLKISKMRSVKKELLKTQREFANLDQTKKIRNVFELMATTEAFMFDWMNEMYRVPDENTPDEKAMAYFEEQLVTLNKMEEDVDSCVQMANEWMTKLTKPKNP